MKDMVINKLDTPKRIKVLIVVGTNEMSLHPVPPVADSAPSWNVYRLVEAIENIDIQVISPCEKKQLGKFNDFNMDSKYHLVTISQTVIWLQQKIFRKLWWPFKSAFQKITLLPDLISWLYLSKAFMEIKKIKPDIIFINDRPQYIQYFYKHLRSKPFYFLMRGEMGNSRRYLHYSSGIIVNSNGIAEYARDILKEKKMNIWCMPNMLGSEFKIPEPSVERFFKSKKRIVFAGRLIPEKGVYELLRAFEIVYKIIPSIELFIYGASDNYKLQGAETPYEKELRSFASTISKDAIRFMGYVNNKDMGYEYAQAYTAVFPSICKESFGMVALEAMRAGVPVVASRRPGFEELIIEDKNGYIVEEPGNPNELADKILNLLLYPHKALTMGEAGYKRSLLYTPDIAAKRFEEIVEEIRQAEIASTILN